MINIIIQQWNAKKILYLLDNTGNQPSKFGTKIWVEINYDPCGNYDPNS